jgi:hypothetical protein
MSKTRSFRRPRSAALVASALLALAVPSAHPSDASTLRNGTLAQTDVDALILRVASTYADATRGILGAHSVSDLTIAAPVFRKTIHDDTWFVFDDGKLVRSAKAPDPRQPPLHDPYRSEYLGEYRYAFAPCAACNANDVEIAFASPQHDTAHARGDLIVERDTGRIVSSDETPYKLPWPTKDGQLDATWGAVAGRWLPRTISGDFVGRIGPFIGHATYSQTLSFSDYPSLDDATKALGGTGTGRVPSNR